MIIGDVFFWPFKAVLGAAYLALGIIVFFLLILMLIDCVKRKFKIEAERWIWIVLMIVTTWVGAILYFIIIINKYPRGVAKK